MKVIMAVCLWILTAAANALTYDCEAASIDTMTPQRAYTIDPQMAGFVMTDSYSTRRQISCAKGDEGRECASIDNLKWCEKPTNHFMVKSIGTDGRKYVIKSRCSGQLKRYTVVNDDLDDYPRVLMDDKMLFQIKHQHIMGAAVNRYPVLIFETMGDAPIISVADFTAEYWRAEAPGKETGLVDGLGYWPVKKEKAVRFVSLCKKRN